MKKKLSPEALCAINNKVKEITKTQLDEKFEVLEKNLIKDIKMNLNDYLTANKYKLEEERVKNYKKRMRSTVKLILEKYKEFSDFMKNFEEKQQEINNNEKDIKQFLEQLTIFDTIDEQNEIDKSNRKSQSNFLTEKQIQRAAFVKKILDNAFRSYKEKSLKKLKVIPVISTQEIDYEDIEANELESKKLKRKLILLQKVYIEGKTLEEIDSFDEVEYIGSKNYQNDVNSLIDDLMILIFGYEGLNYIMLERLGFELL